MYVSLPKFAERRSNFQIVFCFPETMRCQFSKSTMSRTRIIKNAEVKRAIYDVKCFNSFPLSNQK